MADEDPRGAAHWIDHFAVGTNDMSAWVDWAIHAIGVSRQPISLLTTEARKKKPADLLFPSVRQWILPSRSISSIRDFSPEKRTGGGDTPVRFLYSPQGD